MGFRRFSAVDQAGCLPSRDADPKQRLDPALGPRAARARAGRPDRVRPGRALHRADGIGRSVCCGGDRSGPGRHSCVRNLCRVRGLLRGGRTARCPGRFRCRQHFRSGYAAHCPGHRGGARFVCRDGFLFHGRASRLAARRGLFARAGAAARHGREEPGYGHGRNAAGGRGVFVLARLVHCKRRAEARPNRPCAGRAARFLARGDPGFRGPLVDRERARARTLPAGARHRGDRFQSRPDRPGVQPETAQSGFQSYQSGRGVQAVPVDADPVYGREEPVQAVAVGVRVHDGAAFHAQSFARPARRRPGRLCAQAPRSRSLARREARARDLRARAHRRRLCAPGICQEDAHEPARAARGSQAPRGRSARARAAARAPQRAAQAQPGAKEIAFRRRAGHQSDPYRRRHLLQARRDACAAAGRERRGRSGAKNARSGLPAPCPGGAAPGARAGAVPPGRLRPVRARGVLSPGIEDSRVGIRDARSPRGREPGMIQALRRFAGHNTDIVLVLLVVGVLLVLFSPIPADLLDFLLLANFSFALLILLLTFYMGKPVEFSTFPSLPLIATLFRLSLNIAATRLILSNADAGKVIAAVGSYVVQGNYVIGLIIFLILVVVQYVVVTSGAQRVSEVAARFTLDSMPGQQMSIDADLNMGFIDQDEAKRRHKNLEKEAAFYGAMDGASKFVKGDAIAGIIILLINIVGGLIIGMTQMGMHWDQALQTFTLLTIGDGIVTQVPALVIAVGTGIIVTRSGSDEHLSLEVLRQITSFPKTLGLVAGMLAVLMFLPGIPALPGIILIAAAALCAFIVFRKQKLEAAVSTAAE